MINSFSKFYYINEVTLDNLFLNFNEGSGELTAEVAIGDYTPQNLPLAIQTALNDAGLLNYTVTFNRNDRSYTIAANGNFDLLITSGTNVGADIFGLIGFTGPDLTGANTYTGNPAADYYEPQYKLQSYVDSEDLQKAIKPSVNKSASGVIEVVKFGNEKFFEFNIVFITDIDQGQIGPIKTNLNGVNDARRFLKFCVSKNKLEFIPDLNDVNTFYDVILESTEEDKDGTGYRLKELYDKGAPGYFETGKLVFRLVE
jgi:hypothetical protein